MLEFRRSVRVCALRTDGRGGGREGQILALGGGKSGQPSESESGRIEVLIRVIESARESENGDLLALQAACVGSTQHGPDSHSVHKASHEVVRLGRCPKGVTGPGAR